MRTSPSRHATRTRSPHEGTTRTIRNTRAVRSGTAYGTAHGTAYGTERKAAAA